MSWKTLERVYIGLTRAHNQRCASTGGQVLIVRLAQNSRPSAKGGEELVLCVGGGGRIRGRRQAGDNEGETPLLLL